LTSVRQSKQPLLQDRIFPVPQTEREAEQHLLVAPAGDAVLAADVRARPGLIVGHVVPGFDVAVDVLAHAAPLPLAEVGSPLLPWHALVGGLLEALLLGLLVLYAHRGTSSGVSGKRNQRDEGGS
jgi:hypothetical protein